MSKLDTHTPDFNAALMQASAENGLADYYRDCVRPLFAMPMTQWPMCCGGGCEPCAQTLIKVAVRVCDLLDIDPQSLHSSR